MKNTFGLDGGVQLGCRRNGDGVSYLSSQHFSPPVHLSKPYFDEVTHSLLINLSCPTAGLLAGDRMLCDIEVTDQASMVVTTPGATRSHFMTIRGCSKLSKSLRSRMVLFGIQSRSLNLAKSHQLGASDSSGGRTRMRRLLFVEKNLPGRIAHGESFVFQQFSNRLSIKRDNQIVLLESFVLDPENDSVLPWKNSFSTPFYGAFYLISPKLKEHLPCREKIHAMKSQSLLTGATSLHRRAGWVVKVLAGDPYEFKRAMREIRKLLHSAIGRTQPIFEDFEPMNSF